MRNLLSVFVLAALTATHAAAQPSKQEVDALQAQIQALQARVEAATRTPDYATGAAQAVRDGKPHVTVLGCTSRSIAGAVVSQEQGHLTGYDGPAVIVAVPGEGWLVWRATLPATATDAEIAAAFAPRAVQAVPAPFVGPDGKLQLPVGSFDALDELNAQRQRRGLFPFIRDDGLTIAAASAAAYRAPRLMSGHCQNDFAHLPAGASADSAGCAAWSPTVVTTTGETFGACGTDSTQYRYAGAAWVMGSDGRRYSHAFYRR